MIETTSRARCPDTSQSGFADFHPGAAVQIIGMKAARLDARVKPIVFRSAPASMIMRTLNLGRILSFLENAKCTSTHVLLMTHWILHFHGFLTCAHTALKAADTFMRLASPTCGVQIIVHRKAPRRNKLLRWKALVDQK